MPKYYSVSIEDTVVIGSDTVKIPITSAILTGGARLYQIASPNTTYTLTHTGKGVWGSANIPDDVYKLQTNTGSGWVDNAGFSDASGRWIGDNAFDASIITSGTFDVARIPVLPNSKIGAGIDPLKIGSGLVGTVIFDYLANLTSDVQAQLNGLTALNAGTAHLAGSETFTGTKLIRSTFLVDPTNNGKLRQAFYEVPPTNLDYTPKKFVVDYVNDYLLGVTVPMAQQSDRTIRVIYGGTFEGGDNPRVDLTINNAIANAVALTPASNKRYYIFVEKNGLEDGYGASAVVSSFPDFINFSGQNNQCRIFPADDTFTSTTLGNSIIKDFTMEWGNGATATPAFVRKIFQDVVFDINDNAISFNECLFLGNCYVKGTTGTYTITNCNGTPLLADEIPATITGFSPKIYIVGAYNQRNLGIKGSNIASATNITAGTIGNLFTVTGTTNIETLSVSNWTEGSIVSLSFAGALDVVNLASLTSGVFLNKSGANITVSTGTLLHYMLVGTTWFQM